MAAATEPTVVEVVDMKFDLSVQQQQQQKDEKKKPTQQVPTSSEQEFANLARQRTSTPAVPVPPSAAGGAAAPPAAAQAPPAAQQSRAAVMKQAAIQARVKRDGILNPKSAMQMGCIATIGILIVLVWLTPWPFSASDQTAANTHLNLLGVLCDAKNDQRDEIPDIWMFSMSDVLRNDTSYTVFVQVTPETNVQVTNVIRAGEIVATEVIDFEKQQVVVFPQGRQDFAPDRMPSDLSPCEFQPMTIKDKSWVEMGCQARNVDRVVLDGRQVRLIRPLIPWTSAPLGFFWTPLVCQARQQGTIDRTDPVDSQAVEFWLVQAAKDKSLMNQAVNEIVNFMSHDFGDDYAADPLLFEILAPAFRLLAPLYLNQSVSQFQSSTSNLTCCQGNVDCQVQIANAPGLSRMCETFATCAKTNLAWAVSRTCSQNGIQSLCACQQDLRNTLNVPGTTQCGDCKMDVRSCYCYIWAWLIHFVATVRPCACSGQCSQTLYLYPCQTDLVATGALQSTSSELDIRMCPRIDSYSCFRCLALAEVSFPSQEQANTCRVSF